MNLLSAFAYLLSSVFFVFGLKMLSSPKSARRGNGVAALGMLIAIVVTLVDQKILDFTYIVAGLLIGSAIGVFLAVKIQMTSMPQMVGILNGFTVGTRGVGIDLVTTPATSGSTLVLANREGANPSMDNNNNRAVSMRLSGKTSKDLELGLSVYAGRLPDSQLGSAATAADLQVAPVIRRNTRNTNKVLRICSQTLTR